MTKVHAASGTIRTTASGTKMSLTRCGILINVKNGAVGLFNATCPACTK